MEKETKKKSLVPIIVIAIIGVLASLLLGMFIGKNMNGNAGEKTSMKDKTSTEEKTDVQKPTEISLDSAEALKIVNNLKKIYISEKNLYSTKEYNISNMSNFDLVSTAILLSGKEVVSACDWETERPKLTFDYLNGVIKNHLENKKITADTIKSLERHVLNGTDERYYANVDIKLNGDNIELYGPCGFTYNAADRIEKKIIKMTEDDQYIYVYEKHAFGKVGNLHDDPSEHKYNYYDNYAKTGEIIQTIKVELDAAEQSAINWDLYQTTYIYTLKKHADGQYLEKIELQK